MKNPDRDGYVFVYFIITIFCAMFLLFTVVCLIETKYELGIARGRVMELTHNATEAKR